MEIQMDGKSETSFGNAGDLYRNGGSAAPYSNLTLATLLPQAVPHLTRVTGTDTNQNQVVGWVWGNHPAQSTHLAVHYLISSNQDNYVSCKVGGLVSVNAQVTEGCKYTHVYMYCLFVVLARLLAIAFFVHSLFFFF